MCVPHRDLSGRPLRGRGSSTGRGSAPLRAGANCPPPKLISPGARCRGAERGISRPGDYEPGTAELRRSRRPGALPDLCRESCGQAGAPTQLPMSRPQVRWSVGAFELSGRRGGWWCGPVRGCDLKIPAAEVGLPRVAFHPEKNLAGTAPAAPAPRRIEPGNVTGPKPGESPAEALASDAKRVPGFLRGAAASPATARRELPAPLLPHLHGEGGEIVNGAAAVQ